MISTSLRCLAASKLPAHACVRRLRSDSNTSPTSTTTVKSCHCMTGNLVKTGHNTLKITSLRNEVDIKFRRQWGAEEETSAHILCECGALNTLWHHHLGSFFWTLRMLEIWAWEQSVTLLEGHGACMTQILVLGARTAYNSGLRTSAPMKPRTHDLILSIIWRIKLTQTGFIN